MMAVHQARLLQHAIDARRADRHHVGVEHHEGQSPIAFQWMLVVKADDGLFLPVGQPPVAWYPAVMFVDLAVTASPVVELALADPNPTDQPFRGQFGSLFPIANVVDDLIAGIVGNPTSFQSSPSSFFNWT